MKTFIIIITGHRHTSTTLCNKIKKLDNCATVYELFYEEHTKYKMKEYNSIENILHNINIDFKEETIVFKIFQNHLKISDIENILKLKNTYKFKGIFLKRNLKDSYISLRYAEETNEWSTDNNKKDPEQFLKYKNNFNFKKRNKYFEKYKKANENFYKSCENLFIKYKINYKNLEFSDCIKESFDAEQFINSI
jgi:hypothetical protein